MHALVNPPPQRGNEPTLNLYTNHHSTGCPVSKRGTGASAADPTLPQHAQYAMKLTPKITCWKRRTRGTTYIQASLNEACNAVRPRLQAGTRRHPANIA